MHNTWVSKLSPCLVEVSIGDEVVAKAVRADTESSWHIGCLTDIGRNQRVMINVAEIHNFSTHVNGKGMFLALSETRQRKLVLAMVQSLADSQ